MNADKELKRYALGRIREMRTRNLAGSSSDDRAQGALAVFMLSVFLIIIIMAVVITVYTTAPFGKAGPRRIPEQCIQEINETANSCISRVAGHHQ